MSTEIEWKDIPGYEGLYQVSDGGEVKSLQRVVIRKNGRRMPVTESMVSQIIDSSGYRSICLHRSGKRSTARIHKLVAIVFIGDCQAKAEVNHKNGIKTDNRLSNLEYCTRSENVQHAYDTHLTPKGEEHYCAKLNWDKVRQIRSMRTTGLSYSELARLFNVSPGSILCIVKIKTWKE